MLQIEAVLNYSAESLCEILLQLEAAKLPSQFVHAESLEIFPSQPLHRTLSEEGIGERIWLHVNDEFRCTYRADVTIDRFNSNISQLQQNPLATIKDETTKYLMSSRYCHLDFIDAAITKRFDGLMGGARVAAMAQWICETFTYDIWSSTPLTTAHETLKSQSGVCRDYAHALIALARSSAIPARMVSAYGPNVHPQDFHALVEVYLEDAWHLIDPTGMTSPDEIAIIGVGRDAADISFLTSYATMNLNQQRVSVTSVDETLHRAIA